MAWSMTTVSAGASGGTYTNLPEAESVSRPISIVGGVQTTLYGNTVQDIFARKHTFTLNFGLLTDTEFILVKGWMDGTNGPGPFWLKDPRDTANPKNVIVLGLTDDSPMSGWRDGVTLTLQEV